MTGLSAETHRTSHAPERSPGDRIGGKLRLISKLGQGAMGEVWLARHESLKHDVAVKFLSRGPTDEEPRRREHLERFRLEGQVAARLSGQSTHIVSVHDVGATPDGQQFMVMEYVRGQTLEKIIDERNALPVDEVARIVEHVGLALEEAHSSGIVHRDLKPSNLMVVGDLATTGQVRVSDFGVAKLLARDHELDAPQPTREGVLVGSPAYMSPEQLVAETEPGPEADRWALAVVAYEALTGWMPFSGPTLSDLTVSVCQSRHDPPSSLNESLPPGIDEWFAKAFSKEEAARFTDVVEMREAFRAALLTPEAAPERRRASKWLLLAILGAAFITGGVFFEVWRRSNPASPTGTLINDRSSTDAQPVDDAEGSTSVTDPARDKKAGLRIDQLPDGASTVRTNVASPPSGPTASAANSAASDPGPGPATSTAPGPVALPGPGSGKAPAGPSPTTKKGSLDPSEIQ